MATWKRNRTCRLLHGPWKQEWIQIDPMQHITSTGQWLAYQRPSSLLQRAQWSPSLQKRWQKHQQQCQQQCYESIKGKFKWNLDQGGSERWKQNGSHLLTLSYLSKRQKIGSGICNLCPQVISQLRILIQSDQCYWLHFLQKNCWQ